ncbi:hypothetical protein MTP99_016557 [Tenebrio molitor]|nr:hypothetical protein MTP99_016557 [Tenebrio molitor]
MNEQLNFMVVKCYIIFHWELRARVPHPANLETVLFLSRRPLGQSRAPLCRTRSGRLHGVVCCCPRRPNIRRQPYRHIATLNTESLSRYT